MMSDDDEEEEEEDDDDGDAMRVLLRSAWLGSETPVVC